MILAKVRAKKKKTTKHLNYVMTWSLYRFIGSLWIYFKFSQDSNYIYIYIDIYPLFLSCKIQTKRNKQKFYNLNHLR